MFQSTKEEFKLLILSLILQIAILFQSTKEEFKLLLTKKTVGAITSVSIHQRGI